MKNLSIQVDKSRSMMDSSENLVKRDNFVSSLSNPAASYCNSFQSSPVVRSRYHSASSPGLGITALLHDDTKFSSREVNCPSTSLSQSTTSPTASGLLDPFNSTAPERLLSRNHLFNTTSKVTPPLPPPPPPLQSTHSLPTEPPSSHPLPDSRLSDSNSLTTESLSSSSIQISKLQSPPPPPPPPPPPVIKLTRSLPTELPLDRQSPCQLSASRLSDSNSLISVSLSSSLMQIAKLQPLSQITWTPSVDQLSTDYLQPLKEQAEPSTNQSSPSLSPFPVPYSSSSTVTLPLQNIQSAPFPSLPPSEKTECPSPRTFSSFASPPLLPSPLPGIASIPSLVSVVPAPAPSLEDFSSICQNPYLLPSEKMAVPAIPPPPPPFSKSTVVSAARCSVPPPPAPSLGDFSNICQNPSLLPSEKMAVPATPPPPPLFSKSTVVSAARCSIPPPPPPAPSLGDFSNICQNPSLLPLEKMAVPATPPPPPFSKSTAVSAARRSVPPPPPPPSSIQEKATTRSGLAVPPPPAPLVNGLVKVGGTMQIRESINTGNIPSPPLGTKGKFQSRSSTKVQAQPRKASLKPYHWLKLTRALHGSIWAEAQKPEEASKAPELDMTELESLFSATIPNSDHGCFGGKTNRHGSRIKSEKIQLIELRRAYNCEIMLKKVKVPLSDLMNSVLALDDLALDSDQVDNLIKFCPTKEEIDLLKNYKGDKENLGKCEQFFLELMKVPRVESKLRVFSFKIQFWSQVSDLRNSLKTVDSASEEVRRSVKLRRIMQTILSLGNALNHGTAKGSAVGFRLDSLPKLTETRARNNKLTLMHYLCKVLAKNLPEVLDFEKDLKNLEASSKIQLKYLAEEMQAITKGLEKVAQELTASENDGHASEHFCLTLKEFLGSAEAEVRSLASLYSGAGRNADALALYFGEDPARCPFEQVVSTLLSFVRTFRLAHKENCLQIEFDIKKAHREAENDKTKLNASDETGKASASKISKVTQSQN